MNDEYKDLTGDDFEDDGIFEADGADTIGPKELDYFTGTQDRTYRLGFIYYEEPLDKIAKEVREALKDKVEAGQAAIIEKGDVKYVRRPRFLYSKTHWSKETGTFRCFGGQCCKDLPAAKLKAATLVVEYVTDKSGVPKKPFNYEVKILTMNEKLYKEIHRMNGNYPLLSTDALLTCVNEDYKTFTGQPAKGCLWQADPQIMADVLEAAAENWELLKVRSLGKRMKEDQYKALMGIVDRVPSADLSADVSAELADILG